MYFKYIKGYSGELTPEKIYLVTDITTINGIEAICIRNDHGLKGWYITNGMNTNKSLFLDVTTEVRNTTINDILK